MIDVRFASGFIGGVLVGLVTLLVLAVRAAIDGQTGLTLADLLTASASSHGRPSDSPPIDHRSSSRATGQSEK